MRVTQQRAIFADIRTSITYLSEAVEVRRAAVNHRVSAGHTDIARTDVCLSQAGL
jgi:hypothetical protein